MEAEFQGLSSIAMTVVGSGLTAVCSLVEETQNRERCAGSILGEQLCRFYSVVEKLAKPPYNFYLLISLCPARRKAVSQSSLLGEEEGMVQGKKRERERDRMLVVYGCLLFHRFPTYTHIHTSVRKMATEREEPAITLGLSYKTATG